MSLITLSYPEAIAGVEITPLWWSLVSLVHDKNFYYKDRYTFPLIGKPVLLYGTASNDVTGIDVYRGSVNSMDQSLGGVRGSIPSEKIASVIPENGVYSVLLPPCAPGEVELNAIAYNNLNAEVARTRLAWVSTYWASLIWGWYVETMQEYPAIQRLLHPWLSQDYAGIPEIVSNFLPMTKLPQVAWSSLDSARAIVRDALQALYLFPVSQESLTNYCTDWLGSEAVLKDPTQWVLGGTDWRFEGQISAVPGASVSSGFPLLSTLLRSNAYTTTLPASDYTVSSSGDVTLTGSGNTYPGSYPSFEIDVLSSDFLSGDWVGVVSYDVDPLKAWTNYAPATTAIATISTPTHWTAYANSRSNTADSIVSAWNTYITPVCGLQASRSGAPGRIAITASGSGDFSSFEVQKGGGNPDLTPLRVSRVRPINFADPDTVAVHSLGNGDLVTYNSMFLGRAGSPQRHILEGTITGTGDSQPYLNRRSALSLSEWWVPQQDQVTETFSYADIQVDTDGSITGVVGDQYIRVSQPIYSITSYSLDGATPVIVPPDILDLGSSSLDTTVSYSITYYPLAVNKITKAVGRISPSFFTPEVEIDQPWVGPETTDKVWYSGNLDDLSSAGSWVSSSSGLVSDAGVWTVSKASYILADSACYDSSQYVPIGVFSIGDIVTVGRDIVTITNIVTEQYVGDHLYYDQILQESHYAGESIYVPDSSLPRYLESETLDLLEPSLVFPPGKNILLDIVDSKFGDTVRSASVRWSSSSAGPWGAWEPLPATRLLLSSPLDPLAGPTSLGPEYQEWTLSQGAAGTYTTTPLYGTANSVPGFYPSGCLRISGYSSDATLGIQKSFPRGCQISARTISLWARSSGAGGTCTLDLGQRVPLGALEGPTALSYSLPWTAPGSGAGWQQIDIDLSLVPAAALANTCTLRFRVTQNTGNVDVAMLYPQQFQRYFQVQVVVYNARSRTDYVLTRIGIRTEPSKKYPLWPIASF